MTDLTKGSLIILCAIIVLVIFFLAFILYMTKRKDNGEKEENSEKKTKHGMPYEDIKKFVPFDDIRDNMIVQEKGDKFTMIIGCEGINYYLMSEAEKISVEEGFIQFLNSIGFPIQIYVQTRTINLDDCLKSYNEHLTKHQNEFNSLLDSFQSLDSQGVSEERLLEVGRLLEKKEKVLDYTKDLIDNISYLTQNTNVLQKKYYIAVSYHVSEMGLINNLDQSQIFSLALTELTNRADSVRGAIATCGIETHILDTFELIEVMYVAVNRDDADIFNIKKVMDSDFAALSTTSRSTLLKKQDLMKKERKEQEDQEEKERLVREEVERRAARQQRTASTEDSNYEDDSSMVL